MTGNDEPSDKSDPNTKNVSVTCRENPKNVSVTCREKDRTHERKRNVVMDAVCERNVVMDACNKSTCHMQIG